jgi:hypothetical protein
MAGSLGKWGYAPKAIRFGGCSISFIIFAFKLWLHRAIVCGPVDADNRGNPRYDGGRTHPYHPILRPLYFLLGKGFRHFRTMGRSGGRFPQLSQDGLP